MALFRPRIASRDFEERQLPSTRRQVFFDVMKLHWFPVLVCGFVLLIGALPLIVTGIMDYNIMNGLNNAAGEVTGEQFLSVTMMRVILGAVDIFGCVIFGLCLAMVTQFIKLLAWEEPCRIFPAFGQGIKQNGKQYLILSLLFGFFLFGCRYCLIVNEGFMSYLPTIVCLLIPAPMAMYMLVTINLYGVKFTQQMRYAMLTLGKNKAKSALAYLICLIPFALMVVSDMFLGIYVAVIVKSVMFVLLAFFLLGWFLFAYNSLDKAINEKYYPDLVGRGLNLTEYEDDTAWLEY